MPVDGLELATQKMRDAKVPQRAIDVFTYYYGELVEGATGMIPEDSVASLTDVARADEELRAYAGTGSPRRVVGVDRGRTG